MSSQTQLSLCIPESSDTRGIQEFYDNVNQFFLKFPLQYEMLFAVAPNTPKESQALLTTLSEKDPRVRIVQTKKSLARAKKWQTLFQAGAGDFLVPLELSLHIPLGEVFKMLQELYTDTSLDVVFGNRFAKKAPRSRLEAFFQGIIQEKAGWPFRDSFCPTFALRKSAYEKIQSELHSSGWHWTPEIQRVAIKKDLKPIEVPVFDHSLNQPLQRRPGRLESLRLLSFVVFRI
jgi:hypothetical protein